MPFLASLLLPIALCLGMAVVTSALWWQKLPSPWLYAVFALLTTLGLHRLLQAAASVVQLFTNYGFLEFRRPPGFAQLVTEKALSTEAIVTCILLLGLGTPMLVWLRDAMTGGR